ncbi:glutathione S-transferase family protein [Dokdonella koreensis]|uniref:Glutathione S-transferase domain n=1 Tax=Dokdonella koreensis DS-123 TaxID=1300342 RepID=A0A160DSK8_9GAMM|nr:glutathione S-transferase family protein [Dokdonella koreensis]ANB17279.1 Glutathione S-transferase domain [Dokdonella koreensis DS-123]
MSLELFAHPFSSYCQKALIALHENAIPFRYRLLEQTDPQTQAEFAALWPIRRFPMLRAGTRTLPEASIIIEYLQLHHPGPVRLIPDDPDAALQVRLLDRFFDNYISTPQQKIVFDALRAPEARDAHGVAEARDLLERAYAWLERQLDDGRPWAAGDAFTLADCGAAPFLFYADWTHAIDARFHRVQAYRARLLARPSVKRVVDDARPYRRYFPLGAPDRD